MRVLFTSTPNYGHFHPLVPFARALADAGHEVAFAARAAFAPALAHPGFRHFPAGLDRDINDVYPAAADLARAGPRGLRAAGGLRRAAVPGTWSPTCWRSPRPGRRT